MKMEKVSVPASTLLVELQDVLRSVREAEIRLQEAQQRYIQFITENIMGYETES